MDETPGLFIAQVANELSLANSSVQAVIQLLESGNTIPFIARYRKEATGNLDEVQIKAIQERYTYLQELEDRRQVILASIEAQGKLTESLREQILACTVKTALEDLYLPYKPKRRTRAMIAKEKGLEPLADLILSQPMTGTPEQAALAYLNPEKGVDDTDAALAGARDILAERIAEDAVVRTCVRDAFAAEGIVVSKVRPEVKGPTKFEQYYDFKEKVRTIPSHRYLAIRRGEREDVLDFSIEVEEEPLLRQIGQLMRVIPSSPFASQLLQAIEDAFKRLLYPSVETDVRLDLKLASDRAAVEIFANNLRHLLLASPLGGRAVIGIDPGLRTGCKCAAVDETGRYLSTITIYPSQGENAHLQAERDLLKFIRTFQPYAIGIGNGTAGRETEMFVRQLLKKESLNGIIIVAVNEAGASVYSASDIAREEFPDLDLTIRGAISIARRLQDPLAELVKIDPKSIGVGQYQHDVHQPLLLDQLNHVVESCVNHVGVDLNTASASLLSYVSGIGPSLAQKIIKHRESKGAFSNRKQLRDVTGFGAKTFEQAAGFLRIRNGEHPLDASAVHPERYEVVEQMAADLGVPLVNLVNNPSLASNIDLKRYVNSTVGELTLQDIVQELKKPGRDPRAVFEPPCFREDILSIQDLKPGLQLEGIVTNVTAFGAFVDIGVHQDGLIHLSELSHQYIKHPSEAVKTGDKIKVEVLLVDLDRKRIALTARIGQKRSSEAQLTSTKPNTNKSTGKPIKSFQNNPFASL
ncbi:Tex family protein [Candidatus Protochlamydia phocaeensis]|uniref:Tex family protein n=1 Tax=Candidatus Protochlamydia phocaeensis TaxID=1414722 RepID=UPI0008399ED2|nr:Tex family protein [Candidatus Protochlamydia phocaeensis]